MKTFVAEHDGLYLDGVSIVTAKDSREARKILRPKIKEEMKRLGKKASISIKLTEIDTKKPNGFIVQNGDY